MSLLNWLLDLYDLYRLFNTLPGVGQKITRPGGGGEQIMPPAISAPLRARNMKLGGYVELYKNSLKCKFGDRRLIFSRSNDAIIAKFSHFPVKSAGLQLSRSGVHLK